MSRRPLPDLKVKAYDCGLEFDPPEDAVGRWNPALRAAPVQGGTVIEIFDIIGKDWWTGEGVTASAVAAQLKGAGDVTVNINSPGGDFFEGVTIYDLLRSHGGSIAVNVMGLAASAASVIAMAGDTIAIGKAASLMIHNAWGHVIGDKSDLAKAVDIYGLFDSQMAALYADRTGKSADVIAALMAKETWMAGEQAVAEGFANSLLPADAVSENASARAETAEKYQRQYADARMAQAGMTRRERRHLAQVLKNSGMPCAAETTVTPRADLSPVSAALTRLLTLLKS